MTKKFNFRRLLLGSQKELMQRLNRAHRDIIYKRLEVMDMKRISEMPIDQQIVILDRILKDSIDELLYKAAPALKVTDRINDSEGDEDN